VPHYIRVAEAARLTGFSVNKLKDLYQYPGQNFAIKLDPFKRNSPIMYDMDAFYKWLERVNRRKGCPR